MKKYFAQLESDKIGDELVSRIDNYYTHLQISGLLGLWRKSYNYYYSAANSGAGLNKSGEQGEFTTIKVGHYRNLLLHLKTLTVQNRPAFEPRATNTDYKSQAQTILASGLLDYYMRDKHLERHIKASVEHSLVFGEGFIRTEWDVHSGEVHAVDPETQQEVKQGDIKYTNFLPIDVIRDYNKESSDSHDWYIIRSYANRYDLIAKFPDLADKIEGLPSKNESNDMYSIKTLVNIDSDDVVYYEFYHRPTPAVPNGRVVVFLDKDIVLLDGPLPYRTLPVYRIAPEEKIGSCFGYTVGYDLIPVQEALDSLYSTVMTNQTSFGVQNIAVPQGSNLSVSQIVNGLNLIEYDSKLGPPQALNLTQTPAEIFNFIQQLERLQETLSGVNSVARGNPESSLKSGSALALVQSMAVQFSMNLQQSYAQLLEDLGTATINILRDFASVPRIAVIAGISNRTTMKQFTGDDLNLVNRVVVDMGNALSRTTAGKVQLAENMFQMNLVKTPEQYVQVLSTGRLEPVIEGTQAELLNIKAENEEMTEGKEVVVVVTDSHLIHIQEHRAILASPEARRNPELVQRVTAHLQEHINILSDPGYSQLLQLMGQAPLAPQAPVVTPSGNSNEAGFNPNAQMLDATNPVSQEAATVNMPNMPKSPLG